ncbi:MAG: hypothetical protein ACYS5V_09825, partial [Planctomycetota bacterium]
GLDEQAGAYPLPRPEALAAATGMTVHDEADVDWYHFRLEPNAIAAGITGAISMTQDNDDSSLRIALVDGEGQELLSATAGGGGDNTAEVNLGNLAAMQAGDYYILVTHADALVNGTATIYQLDFAIGGEGETGLDLAGEDLSSFEFAVLTDTTYYLKVTAPSRAPTVYDVSLTLDEALAVHLGEADPTPKVDLSTRTDVIRKDVIIGGDGHDVLSGGLAEDWIFGGDGNDVLTGGLDQQASDLLFGGAGNDTFQVLPDSLPIIEATGQTYLPTLNDRFDGGEDDDRVLFLGGDTDRLGLDVPDHVAIRYNRFLYRYEFTALVWDTANQQYMTELSGEQEVYTQHYAFYQAVDVEKTVIETRAGNDQVRGDAEYMFPLPDGSGFVESEWGIKAGNFQEGATIGHLEILGGDGNDRLFGGYLNDVIDGGSGTDFIAGGYGDDAITGGPGGDLLLGNDGLEPDRYEFITRGREDGRNDSPIFAALLGDIAGGSVISDLSFNLGDAGDWYVIPAPAAASTFGEAETAMLSHEMVQVSFEEDTDQTLWDGDLVRDDLTHPGLGQLWTGPEWTGPNVYLFAAVIDDPEIELSLIPTEEPVGTADYYMLHVLNVHSFSIRATHTVHVTDGAADATFRLSIDGEPTGKFTVQISDGGAALAPDVIADNLNLAFADMSFGDGLVSDRVVAYADQDRIVLFLRGAGELAMTYAAGSTAEMVGFENGQDNLGPAMAMGPYAVTFDATVGQITDVDTDAAGQHVTPPDPTAVPVMVPLGDVNGDGLGDFIISVTDTVGTWEQYQRVPFGVHPQEIVGPSYATVYLSDPALTDVTAEDGAYVTLRLPAPVLSFSYLFPVGSRFASAGDYNNDGVDDIAVVVTNWEPGSDPQSLPYSQQGVYVVYGHDDPWPETVDVVYEADVILSGYVGPVSVDSAGDVNFDG